MIVYVAGPYNAPNAFEREQNIRRAENVGRMLLLHTPGIVVAPIVPHTMSRFYFGEISEPRAELWNRELLGNSEAVVLIDHAWGASRGTCIEVAIAKELAIPVYTEHAMFSGNKALRQCCADEFLATPLVKRVLEEAKR